MFQSPINDESFDDFLKNFERNANLWLEKRKVAPTDLETEDLKTNIKLDLWAFQEAIDDEDISYENKKKVELLIFYKYPKIFRLFEMDKILIGHRKSHIPEFLEMVSYATAEKKELGENQTIDSYIDDMYAAIEAWQEEPELLENESKLKKYLRGFQQFIDQDTVLKSDIEQVRERILNDYPRVISMLRTQEKFKRGIPSNLTFLNDLSDVAGDRPRAVNRF